MDSLVLMALVGFGGFRGGGLRDSITVMSGRDGGLETEDGTCNRLHGLRCLFIL